MVGIGVEHKLTTEFVMSEEEKKPVAGLEPKAEEKKDATGQWCGMTNSAVCYDHLSSVDNHVKCGYQVYSVCKSQTSY